MSQIESYLKTKPALTRMVLGYLVKDNEVILGLRKEVSWGLGKNLICGIGGKIGDVPGLENESDSEAMARETLEEIGLAIKNFNRVGKVIFLFPNKPKWNQEVIIYLIKDWTGEPSEQEKIKPLVFKHNALPQEQMWDDNQYWVPQVLAGKKVEATILFAEDNKTVAEKQILFS